MNKISVAMRDLLIEHIDGRSVPVIVRRHRAAHESLPPNSPPPRLQVRNDGLRRGFLRYDEPMVRRSTVITEAGRGALALALAEWADALVRAGIKVEDAAVGARHDLAFLRKWATQRSQESHVV